DLLGSALFFCVRPLASWRWRVAARRQHACGRALLARAVLLAFADALLKALLELFTDLVERAHRLARSLFDVAPRLGRSLFDFAPRALRPLLHVDGRFAERAADLTGAISHVPAALRAPFVRFPWWRLPRRFASLLFDGALRPLTASRRGRQHEEEQGNTSHGEILLLPR